MNAATVNTLATMIRQRTDETNAANLDDTTELKPWIRASLAQLYEIMVSRWKDWNVASTTLSLLANVESYALPDDCRAINKVYMLYSSGAYREPLPVFTMQDFGRFSNQNLYRSWPAMYRVMRNKLYLTPAPAAAYANVVEVWYTPQFTATVSDDDPIDATLPNGFEEWVVLDVCIKIRDKFRLDATSFKQERAAVEDRLVAGASLRTGDAPVMVDAFSAPQWTWFNGAPSGRP
jgi:hypothetical protein